INKKLIPHNFVFWQYFLDHIFDLFYYGQFIPESRGQFNQNLQQGKSVRDWSICWNSFLIVGKNIKQKKSEIKFRTIKRVTAESPTP
ncbi:hypothetical protein, partial [Chryseobacterium fistulae]|uniref:hypothetical protein n=1 Tax=Chryseobacterium fistulae TaxID=2675058 RepID=UPI001E594111